MEKSHEMYKPIRTLLVDDSLSFVAAASQFLATAPALKVVGTAYSGPEGLEQVSVLKPDLVLLDLAMPGLNGWEVTCHLKQQPGSPSVIVLTLHDTAEYRSKAARLGADGFVAKSDFGTELLPLIYNLFEVANPEGQGIKLDRSGWID